MNHTQAPGARLQQQPQRLMDRQQQQSSGSREFQPRRSQPAGVPASQMGGASAVQQLRTSADAGS